VKKKATKKAPRQNVKKLLAEIADLKVRQESMSKAALERSDKAYQTAENQRGGNAAVDELRTELNAIIRDRSAAIARLHHVQVGANITFTVNAE
jgi:hypothetical protein